MGRGKVLIGGIALVALLGVGYWKYHDTLFPAANTGQQATADAKGGNGKRGNAGPVLVKLDTVKKTDFPLIERNYGVMASPNVVGINARVASQITKVNVQDGQLVKAGDVLVELDDRTLQATLAKDQATLAKDQAALVNAQIVLQRSQTLFEKNAGPKQDVDTNTAAEAAAQKTVDADNAVIDADKVQLDYAKITAPFDGKLGQVSATVGQLVAASTTSTPTTSLMTVTQMQPLKVNFTLPEQTLPDLRDKMDANGIIPPDSTQFIVRVSTSGSDTLLDTGKLDFVDSTVDQASGTIGLGGEVGNSKLNLWPGQQVNVELEYGKIEGAMTVPAVAVQQGQQGPYIWVVDDQNKVKATQIKVSRYENNMAAIDTLKEGTKVVTEGQTKLTDGAEVRVQDDKQQQPQQQSGDASAKSANAGGASGSAEAATPDTGGAMKKNATAGATQQ